MKRETRNHTFEYGYQNVALEFNGKRVTLQAGTNDNLTAHYYDKERTIVVSTNTGLGYCGAELINRNTLEVEHEIFLQNACEEIGEDWDTKSDCWLADVLNNWLYA